VVTGSRIGDPLGKQAPVLTMTREDLERTGLSSVGDILQQLPVSGGAINGKYNSSGNFGSPPDGGGIGAGLHYANHGNVSGRGNPIQCQGSRGIAGDDERLRAMRFQEVCGLYRVACDSFYRFGAVGKAGGVAKIRVIGTGDELQQSFQDG